MAKEVKTIGVLTSGGDAPGMNAAIRAVVRKALSQGLKVKGINQGYKGLLNEEIIDMDARSVSDTLAKGGTILYTARCSAFRTEEGQNQAAEICRKHGIDGLVVIGARCQQPGVPTELPPLATLSDRYLHPYQSFLSLTGVSMPS